MPALLACPDFALYLCTTNLFSGSSTPDGYSPVHIFSSSVVLSHTSFLGCTYSMSSMTFFPSSTVHASSMMLMPFPMASNMSISTSSKFSIPLSCSSTKSATSLSLSSCENGCTSQSSPVTASFLVCICEKRWVSFSSISSKSSICALTLPSSASRKIRASLRGVSPLDG